jgi:PII-like signaling protein
VNGDGLMLTSYGGGWDRPGGQFTADALLALYRQHEIASSILLRGTQGLGLRHHLRTGQSPARPENRPVMTVAVDTPPHVRAVMGQALDLASPGLLTLDRVWLADGATTPVPRRPGLADGQARLTVFLGREEKAYQIPAFEAVCDLLYRRCMASATALLGVDGTRNGQRQRGRAEVPVMVVAVGEHEQIRAVIPEISGLLRHPRLTVDPVRVCKRDGQLLGVPDRSPGTGEHGLLRWQKLTVHAPEAAQHHGQHVHRALVQRLLAAGVAGLTTLRGVWGFHGDQAPHGDGRLHLARHVPAITTVVDAPERIPAVFAIIDEVTAGRGLVTSEATEVSRAAADLPEGRR